MRFALGSPHCRRHPARVTVTETITWLLAPASLYAYSQANIEFAMQGGKMIPVLMIVAATIAFFIAERVLPGRELPEAPGWYARAAFLNLCQVGIVLVAG